jgi:hypothetical protein
MITMEQIQEEILLLENIKTDDEAAHAIEDDLYFKVLTAIANGAENAAELAFEALRASEINFARWCA